VIKYHNLIHFSGGYTREYPGFKDDLGQYMVDSVKIADSFYALQAEMGEFLEIIDQILLRNQYSIQKGSWDDFGMNKKRKYYLKQLFTSIEDR
jgi:hypothetical protein